MTMAEMRLNEAGGPSRTVMPAGIASPVAAPTPPGPRALTDAARTLPLGKQWVFTRNQRLRRYASGPAEECQSVMSRGNGRVAGPTSCNPLTASFEIKRRQRHAELQEHRRGRAMCGKPNVDVEDAVIDAMRGHRFVRDGRQEPHAEVERLCGSRVDHAVADARCGRS